MLPCVNARCSWAVLAVIGLILPTGQMASAQTNDRQRPPEVLFNLPEAVTLAKGQTRLEWNYTFLRGNRHDRVFNADQTVIATRSNHRKTHLVTWRVKHGLNDWVQPEAEIIYKAYRQHTHGNDDTHDRNDDGDFERLLAGLSVQAVRESARAPNLRLRGGVLIPRRAETEDIGQEAGLELLAASSKALAGLRVVTSIGFAMTFDNREHPSDPTFELLTPTSKGHDLRTLTYGVGLVQPFATHWQANLELDGRAFDTIQLNRRIHQGELTLTPGLVFRRSQPRWDWWLGLGIPIGLSRPPESQIHQTDAIGVSVRTGITF